MENNIYTVAYIEGGNLQKNYVFTSDVKAMDFAKRLFIQLFDNLDSDDYIAVDVHVPDSEEDAIRLRQYDMDDDIEEITNDLETQDAKGEMVNE